jgi:hypothetical protein
VSQHVQVALPAEENRGQHANRPYDQDVDRHDYEREDRANGRNEHGGMINEKAPLGLLPSGASW